MPSHFNRRHWLLLALAALTQQVQANGFPSQPIKVIVPYPAGGNADNIARVFAKRLSEPLVRSVLKLSTRHRLMGTLYC